jgi:spermidine synthase
MLQVLRPHGAPFAAGLLAIAAQVLLLRELVVDVAGDELAIGVGLAAWLLGIALGASLARRRSPVTAARDGGVGMALLAVLPVLAMIAGRLLRRGVGPDPGELPGLGLTLVLAASTLAPPGALVGWTFTALASSASRRWAAGEAIARVYIFESIGSLVGGLGVTLLVGPGLAPLPAAALVGVLAGLLALAAARDGVVSGRRALIPAAALGAALLLVSGPLDAWSERARFAGVAPGVPLRAVLDTPWQHLALGGEDDVWHLYASGQYAASFPDPIAAESLGHLVACLAPRPERVLLVGGAERGLVSVLLRHPVREIVLVEPDRWAFTFIRERMAGEERTALSDPRVRVVHVDPRRLLERTDERFGLVLLLGPEPVTLLRARLWTTEFFRLCGSRLAPDGVLVASVRTAPNVLVGETAALAGSLFGALKEALPVVRATPGPDTLLVAGWTPTAATLDPTTLAARWDRRGIEASSFAAALFPVLLPPGRVAAQEEALRDAAANVAPSRDDRPASFLHALARRQQTTAGETGRLVGMLGRLPVTVLVLLALMPSLLMVLRLRAAPTTAVRRARAASHAVAVGGAAGMGFWLLLLLSFQTRVGALYGALGALTAVFMLGLALGAVLARRTVAATGEGWAGSTGLKLILGAGLSFAVTLPWTLVAARQASASGPGLAFLAHGALLLAAGVVTGTLFPTAAVARLAAGETAAEAAGRLETADHAGAAVAALLGAVLFIPALGLTRAAWLLAALLALALVAVPAAGSGGGDRSDVSRG